MNDTLLGSFGACPKSFDGFKRSNNTATRFAEPDTARRDRPQRGGQTHAYLMDIITGKTRS